MSDTPGAVVTPQRTRDNWRSRIASHADVAPADLLPSPLNARRHPANQAAALDGVLSELGWIQSVIVSQASGRILDGHLRVERALAHGEPTVPVVYVDVTEQEEAYALATLDPISAMAETDADALTALLERVGTDDDAVRAMLDGLAADAGIVTGGPPAEDPGAQIDRAEELRQKWQTERGQLWEIGRHRLLCGDSTSAEDVARLMDAERATACITDPPYNVDIEYGDGSSDSKSVADYLAFTRSWFGHARRLADQVLLTTGTGRGIGMPNVRLWLDLAHPDWILVWVKKNTISRSSLGGFNAWEPIFFYGKPRKKIGQDIYDIPITVQQDAAAEDGSKLHPTPKQVKLWSAMIEDFTDADDLLYEPFSGSGTTLVAAEQAGRICYALEIEPKYVAVALERLAGMGLEPRLT